MEYIEEKVEKNGLLGSPKNERDFLQAREIFTKISNSVEQLG